MNTTLQRNDPIARACVLGLFAVALWAAAAQLGGPQAQAQTGPGDIIIMATPSLPTPVLQPTDAPALVPAWPVASQEGPGATEGGEGYSGSGIALPAPALGTTDTAGDQALFIQELNDPALNGGNVAPEGCLFPIINGMCANGVLAKDVPDSDPAHGQKSTADPGPAPTHAEKVR